MTLGLRLEPLELLPEYAERVAPALVRKGDGDVGVVRERLDSRQLDLGEVIESVDEDGRRAPRARVLAERGERSPREQLAIDQPRTVERRAVAGVDLRDL